MMVIHSLTMKISTDLIGSRIEVGVKLAWLFSAWTFDSLSDYKLNARCELAWIWMKSV